MLNYLLEPAWIIFFALVSSYVVAHIMVPVIIRVSREKHLMDEPNNRSSHTQRTPSLGGVAIFVALTIIFMTGTALAGQQSQAHLILPSLVILFFTGLKDDILVIDPYKKLGAQLLAGTLLIICTDIRIGSMYGLFGIYEVPYAISFLFTLFVMVITINAYNLIDGIDGLAGGLGIVVCTTFGIYFYIADLLWATILCATLIGVLAGFIQFNFSQTHKIFMGDCGSLIVGFVLALLTVKFLQVNEINNHSAYMHNAPGLAIAALLIPLFDTLRVFIHRIANGNKPFHADRNHIHHFVIDKGFSHMQASMMLCGASAMIISLGFFAFAQTSVVASFMFLSLLFITYSVVVRRKKNVIKQRAKYSKYYVSKPVVVGELHQEPVN